MSYDIECVAPCGGLRDAKEKLLRPAVGFEHPRDVLRDPFLDNDGKRAVLSSWASDASAVEDWPMLRWLFGTPRPVPVTEVLEALATLDKPVVSRGASSGPSPINTGSDAVRVTSHFQ